MRTVKKWHTVLNLALASALAIVLLFVAPNPAPAHAAEASPAGDDISIGDPAAPGQIDLYLGPLCPYSGKFIRAEGDAIGKRIEAGKLHVNLRLVNFLEKYSASGTYDSRAIYAAFVVADESQDSGATWRFIQQIYSADNQPHEEGDTDLDNNQLAGLAERAGAPQSAQDRIRLGLPIQFDVSTIAANNFAALKQFPKSGVPWVVINGTPVDTDTDWLARLPR